jgi:hypothetical protein
LSRGYRELDFIPLEVAEGVGDWPVPARPPHSSNG